MFSLSWVLDVNENGFICDRELTALFKEANLALPGFRIREIVQEMDRDKDNQLNFEEFIAVGNTD
jgi:plastin-2